jgi:DNA polymerase-3 subunit alpha
MLRKPPDVDAFCGQIDEEMAGQVVVVAGQLASVRQLTTKKGQPFVRAVLEDVDGSVEVTVWSEVYERTRDLWVQGRELMLRGRVKMRGEQVQLICHSATPYSPPQYEGHPELTRKLLITIAQTDNPDADVARLQQVVELLTEFPGNDEVRLAIEGGSGITELEMPHLTTRYCPELQERLAQLVGEDGVVAETEEWSLNR